MQVNGCRLTLQNIFFCAPDKKESHTVLKRQKGEQMILLFSKFKRYHKNIAIRNYLGHNLCSDNLILLKSYMSHVWDFPALVTKSASLYYLNLTQNVQWHGCTQAFRGILGQCTVKQRQANLLAINSLWLLQ